MGGGLGGGGGCDPLSARLTCVMVAVFVFSCSCHFYQFSLPCLSVDLAVQCAFDDAQNHFACDIHTACSSQVTNRLYIVLVCLAAIPICFAYFFNYRFHFLFKMTVFARFEVCIAVWLSIPFFSGLTQSHWVKGFLLTRRH